MSDDKRTRISISFDTMADQATIREAARWLFRNVVASRLVLSVYDRNNLPQEVLTLETDKLEYYSIGQAKLAEVVTLIMATRTRSVPSGMIGDYGDLDTITQNVRSYLLADWPEIPGQPGHQEWLNEADSTEIADWVISGNAIPPYSKLWGPGPI